MKTVHPAIGLTERDGGSVLACLACDRVLCDVASNYRLHVTCESRPIGNLGPLFRGREDTITDRIVIRTYRCPECGARLDQEVCPESAAPIFDLQLAEREDKK